VACESKIYYKANDGSHDGVRSADSSDLPPVTIAAAAITIDFTVPKEKTLCVGNTVNKGGAGRRHLFRSICPFAMPRF